MQAINPKISITEFQGTTEANLVSTMIIENNVSPQQSFIAPTYLILTPIDDWMFQPNFKARMSTENTKIRYS